MAQKKFSSAFKANVAIEALKSHKTTNEIASKFEVHPTHAIISITRQGELIQLSRAGYYRTVNDSLIIKCLKN